ncbi:MAG TPA: sugar transferase [Gaiellaceae bacterium]|nr:sugar transferase [Gaiellaceae bacterium]
MEEIGASVPQGAVTVPPAPAALPQGETRPRRRGRGWLVRRALLLADVVGLTTAFLVAEAIIAARGRLPIDLRIELIFFASSLPVFVVLAKLYGLYDRDEERTNHTTVDDFIGVFHLCTVAVWVLYAGAWMTGIATPPLEKLAFFWIASVAFVPVARSTARALCRRRSSYFQNTLVVGAGAVGQLVARKLRQHTEYGIRLVGFVDADPLELRADISDVPLYGSLEELPDLVRQLDVDRVVVAFSRDSHEQVLTVVRTLNELDVQVDIVPRLFEMVGPSVEIRSVEALPLVGLPPRRPSRSSRVVKRTIDLVGSALLIVLLAPLLAYIALRVKLDSKGPVLFKQERVGLSMRPFTVLKFRSMRPGTDDSAHRRYIRETMDRHTVPHANGLYKLERDDAVTRFGHWLRRTSLDELPQLFNVLRGDMSLVGPRPCIAYELENFAPHHFDRFLVRPGMTGLWQVTARAHSTFGEALDIDAGYVHGWSLGLDLWLLCRTPLEVLRGRRATA